MPLLYSGRLLRGWCCCWTSPRPARLRLCPLLRSSVRRAVRRGQSNGTGRGLCARIGANAATVPAARRLGRNVATRQAPQDNILTIPILTGSPLAPAAVSLLRLRQRQRDGLHQGAADAVADQVLENGLERWPTKARFGVYTNKPSAFTLTVPKSGATASEGRNWPVSPLAASTRGHAERRRALHGVRGHRRRRWLLAGSAERCRGTAVGSVGAACGGPEPRIRVAAEAPGDVIFGTFAWPGRPCRSPADRHRSSGRSRVNRSTAGHWRRPSVLVAGPLRQATKSE